MKLLITTQALDSNDPVLGFFVRWVEELASHCEQVTVICLRKGEYALPSNVRVFPLGGGTKLTRAYKLLWGAYKFRANYDVVFVHMNPEYLVAAGFLWRILGKRSVLWYMHKTVDLKLRVATLFANAAVTGSRESFRLKTNKLTVLHHGIDTEYFSPDPSVPRGLHWLSVGRLTLSKRHDLIVREAAQAHKELRIVGEGPERAHLEALAKELDAQVEFLGGRVHSQLRDEYRRAALFVHRSETGSLDKVVLEALACDCPVTTTDPALKFLESEGRGYVQEHHSLPVLIQKLAAILRS